MARRFAFLLSLVMVAFLTTANAQWKYAKVFPDTNLTLSTGLNNCMTTDPTGRVWIMPYTGNVDSVKTAAGTYAYCWHFYVYNPDGSLYKTYGPILDFNGTPDTLFTAAAGYGMTNDHEGNIVAVKNSLTIRKIDYQTGKEIARSAVRPIPGYASSMTSPMCDAADELFITSVIPTTGVGPVAFSSDFSTVLISVDTSMYGAYSRNVTVTADGNDVWVHHIGLGSLHYHSDNGTLGPYVLDPDTAFKDLVIESSAWQPKTGWLWVSSGNVTSGMPNPPYSGYAWYGFDMTNRTTPVLKDSIVWNPNTGLAADLISADPRPRGIAFSPSGDTAYVAAFSPSKGFIEMFTGKVNAISPPPSSHPSSYSLSQNYPNPFNPTTKIDYTLMAGSKVTLAVYDVLGREVATIVNAYQPAGLHSVSFDASRLSSGIYIYTLKTSNGVTITKKMVLMK